MPIPASQDHRLFAPWSGEVVEVRDQRGLHQIRASIPGLLDKDPITSEVATTRWALPLTVGGGSAQHGGHVAPKVGAEVVIWFLGGDERHPRYVGGYWGTDEPPQRMAEAGGDAHLVHSLQVGSFAITIDERPRDAEAGTGQLVEIADLSTTTNPDFPGTSITIDLEGKGIDISADYLLRLRAVGQVEIEGAIVTINGRAVQPGKQVF
jgi:hypothetical protein